MLSIHLKENCSSLGRGGPFREFGYFSSSAKARITSAITNRQSMAIVTATRIQDDLFRHRSHTRKEGAVILSRE
jgi:hypothetical protein